jgi:hypothetical protein
MKQKNIILLSLTFLFGFGFSLKSHSNQTRIEKDISNNEAIVIHTLVALADNKNQFIVPVPESLGNGQNKNLTFIGELCMELNK